MNKFNKDKRKPFRKPDHKPNNSSGPSLKIIPISGLEAIGKNMTLIEYGNDIIAIDCGMMFPDETMLGIDYVIPDITYLKKNKKKLKAIIITHGHEDHIGAIAHLVPELGVPVYASSLAKALIEARLEEFKNTKNVDVRLYKPDDELAFGVFRVSFFEVNHSIPDSFGIIIKTPEGIVVHTGDFKFDLTSPNHIATDIHKLTSLGKNKVLVLLSESTNAEQAGHTISEKAIEESFDKIFSTTKGRLIISSFASRIDRMQHVLSAAKKHGRKVTIAGRSMLRYFEAASKLGFLEYAKDLLVPLNNIKNIPDSKIVVLSTGSQGQQGAALARMAFGEHRQINIKKGDTVVLSSSPIPGNERSISAIINNLTRKGAEVIHSKTMQVHVTGHAFQEELKMMIQLVKPKYFIPIHGEYHMRYAHKKLALDVGIPEDNIFLVDEGQVIEVKQNKARISKETVPAGLVMVDGLGVGDVGEIVLRDRKALAEDGMFVVIATVDGKTGKLIGSPDIISRGFVYMREKEDLINRARNQVKKILSRPGNKTPDDWSNIKHKIRENLGQFLYQETKRRPMVLPVVIEV